MMSESDCPGQLIILFGGASGIGLATACLAAKRGYDVLISDLATDGPKLEPVQSGQVRFAKCDATDAEEVAALLRQHIGGSGGAACNVVTTVGGATFHDPLEVDLAAWRREQTFNLDSAYLVATTAAKLMKEGGNTGSIVMTSSTIAATPRPERIGYAAAKAGVIALTKGLALAVAGDGIRVNCVAPHTTDTPRLRALIGEEGLEERVRTSVQRRIAVPQDMAETILFLASDAARSTTGQVFWVNNGNYMP